MGPSKVTITLLDADAVDPARGLPKEFSAQFNPTEFQRTKAAQIAEVGIPGLDSPILQFVRGQNERLSLSLFFDTTGDGLGARATDVQTLTRPFYQLVKIQPKTHAPPRVKITWGQALDFVAVAESVQQTFNLFSPEGVPVRATLVIAFREHRTLQDQINELRWQSADHTKVHVVQRGETLSSIAQKHYRDPGAWRPIAEHNGIVNPLRLIPGSTLKIPPTE